MNFLVSRGYWKYVTKVLFQLMPLRRKKITLTVLLYAKLKSLKFVQCLLNVLLSHVMEYDSLELDSPRTFTTKFFFENFSLAWRCISYNVCTFFASLFVKIELIKFSKNIIMFPFKKLNGKGEWMERDVWDREIFEIERCLRWRDVWDKEMSEIERCLR